MIIPDMEQIQARFDLLTLVILPVPHKPVQANDKFTGKYFTDLIAINICNSNFSFCYHGRPDNHGTPRFNWIWENGHAFTFMAVLSRIC